MVRNSSFAEIMILLPALLLALTVHELCHGLAAYFLGDNTAKRDGRLSLNPVRHIDPIGLLMILFVGFGWAKPVMVNPYNLRNPKVDMAFIAFAGPLSNFIMSFLSMILLFVFLVYFPGAPTYLVSAVQTFTIINIMLAIFNLLPIPPLDGSKVIGGILPESIHRQLPPIGQMGMFLLLILMITGITGRIISPIVFSVYDAFFRAVFNIFQLFN